MRERLPVILLAAVALAGLWWYRARGKGRPTTLNVSGDLGGTHAASVPEALVALEAAISAKHAEQPTLQQQFNENYADRSGDGSLRMLANYLYT